MELAEKGNLDRATISSTQDSVTNSKYQHNSELLNYKAFKILIV